MESAQPTRTQISMITLCARGMSRDEIARELSFSPWTVKEYLQDLRQMLGAINTTHALALCIVQGYLYIDPVTHEVRPASERRILATAA